jgi:hypothetical protein
VRFFLLLPQGGVVIFILAMKKVMFLGGVLLLFLEGNKTHDCWVLGRQTPQDLLFPQ